jgi:hypothetical protein
VEQLAEALHYNPEGTGFDSRWYLWDSSLTLFFRPHYVPGVDLAPKNNEYQGYLLGGKCGRCLGLKSPPTSDINSLETLGARISWDPQALSKSVQVLLYLYL